MKIRAGGSSSNKTNNCLPRKQRSQSLERARSPDYRHTLQPPAPGLLTVSPTAADPDMVASNLAEQEYLQSLGEQLKLSTSLILTGDFQTKPNVPTNTATYFSSCGRCRVNFPMGSLSKTFPSTPHSS